MSPREQAPGTAPCQEPRPSLCPHPPAPRDVRVAAAPPPSLRPHSSHMELLKWTQKEIKFIYLITLSHLRCWVALCVPGHRKPLGQCWSGCLAGVGESDGVGKTQAGITPGGCFHTSGRGRVAVWRVSGSRVQEVHGEARLSF